MNLPILAVVLAAALSASAAPDAKTAACVADGGKESKAVQALEAKGLAAPERTPADEKEFKAMDLRLKAIDKRFAKPDLAAAECDAIAKDLAKERALVDKMTAGYAKSKPSPVAACVAETLKERQALEDRIAKAEAAGKVRSTDPKIRDREARLADIAKRLGKSGLSLPDCAAIGKDVADETKALDSLIGK